MPESVIDGDQWDRQKRIQGWMQDRVAKSRCLVFGAGALGNEVVKNLLQLGVGDITVVDYDRVVTANLNRCVFFTPEDAEKGNYKATVLARRAALINPDAKVTAIVKDLESLPPSIYTSGRFDYAFSCLDNLGARLHVNAHCYGRMPLIDGGTTGFSGKVQVVSSPSSCLECSMTKRDYNLLWRKYSCTGEMLDLVDPKMPALPTTTSIIAGLQVTEFVKLCHSGVVEEGVNEITQKAFKKTPDRFAFPSHSLIGSYLFYNGLSNDHAVFAVDKRRNCPVHATR